MTAIIDYGVGNLFSLESSLRAVGEEACVTSDPAVIRSADRIILPGVGAFGDAAAKLADTGLISVIRDCAERGVPLLGICLGMQLLLERGYEYGVHDGLGLIKGEIRPISEVIERGLKIPHIGWNSLSFPENKSPLFKYVDEGEHVYFVHSFSAQGTPSAIAHTDYGGRVVAAVGEGNILGCQFHPEKSGRVGLNILRAFCEMGGAK